MRADATRRRARRCVARCSRRVAVGVGPLAGAARCARTVVAAAVGRARTSSPSSATKVKPFGLRVTRAALVDPDNRSATHRARTSRSTSSPPATTPPQDYLDGTVDVSKVFLPYVFDAVEGPEVVRRVPGAATGGRRPPDAARPRPRCSRRAPGSRLVDWKTVDVATMLADVTGSRPRPTPTNGDVPFSVFVAKHLQNTPAYEDAGGHGRHDTGTSTPAAHRATVRDYG